MCFALHHIRKHKSGLTVPLLAMSHWLRCKDSDSQISPLKGKTLPFVVSKYVMGGTDQFPLTFLLITLVISVDPFLNG